MFITWGALRGVLVLSKNLEPPAKQSLAAIVEIVTAVNGLDGSTGSTGSNSSMSPYVALIKSITLRLEELFRYMERHRTALIDANGPAVVGNDLQTILEKIAERPDIDSAKLYMGQVGRFVTSAVIEEHRGVEDRLKEMAKLLRLLDL